MFAEQNESPVLGIGPVKASHFLWGDPFWIHCFHGLVPFPLPPCHLRAVGTTLGTNNFLFLLTNMPVNPHKNNST